MLEQAVGSIECRTLRKLVQLGSTSVRSRRMLHSAFWTHGAGELDLPPWWTSILQGPGSADGYLEGSRGCQGRYGGLAAAPDSRPLDFLYPRNALALIQQFTSYGLEKWERRRSRYDLINIGKRPYTSSSSFNAAIPRKDIINATSESTPESTEDSEPFDQLRDLLRQPIQKDLNDEILSSYLQCPDDARRRELSLSVIRRLSYSDRRLDAERSITIFEHIPLERRTAVHYRFIVKAYVKLGRAVEALSVIQESWTKGIVNCGEHRLLAYAVDQELWDIAVDTLQYSRYNADARVRYRLWNLVRYLPSIWDRGLALVAYTNKHLRQREVDSAPNRSSALVRFLQNMALNVLFVRDVAAKDQNVLNFFRILHSIPMPKSYIYNRAIRHLLAADNTKTAVMLYKDLRKRDDAKPNREIMFRVLQALCNRRSIRGVQTLMDDWFRFYGAPEQNCYEICMAAFAALGNNKMVEMLFDQMVSRFGKPRTLHSLTSLLQVYAKRGEFDEVTKQFNRIRDEFGLQPNVVCWNIMLNVHVKMRDVGDIRQCYEVMIKSGVEPDDYTIGTLMGACASRGDVEGAEQLYQLSKDLGVRRTTAMVDALVWAYVKDDQLNVAEDLVEKAMAMDLEGPRTIMWNHLLAAHALRRDVFKTKQLSDRMQQLKVRFDGNTYAALMQFLTNIRRTDVADKILRRVLPREKIQPTAFHYAIVMGGYAGQGEIRKVFNVLARMRFHNVRTTISTHIALLRTMAAMDLRDAKSRSLAKEAIQFTNTENYLKRVLEETDASERAVEEPIKGILNQPLMSAYPAAYFDRLIYLYGQEGLPEKAFNLHDLYIDTNRNKLPVEEVLPTIKLIAALMATHLEEEQYEEVATCWRRAKEIAKRLSTPLWNQAGSDKQKRTLSAQRYLLSLPFRFIARSLSNQGKCNELIQEVESLLHDGYDLDNGNYNEYIRHLAQDRRVLLAFDLCETRLMPGWTGWDKGLHQSKKTKRKDWQSLLRQPMEPSYRTMVYLAGVYVELTRSKMLGIRDAEALVEEIESKCPRTMDAIEGLPRQEDGIQLRILGQE